MIRAILFLAIVAVVVIVRLVVSAMAFIAAVILILAADLWGLINGDSERRRANDAA